MSSETPNTSTSKLTEAEQLVEAWAEEFCAAAGTWWEAKELVKKVADKVEWKRQIFDPDLWYAVNEAFKTEHQQKEKKAEEMKDMVLKLVAGILFAGLVMACIAWTVGEP